MGRNGMKMNKLTKKEITILDVHYPVCQAFHTGLWGWSRINGCVDLSMCHHKTERAAKISRNKQGKEIIKFLEECGII